MKRVKILTILFISLFAFNVSAIVDEYGNQSNGSTINIIYDTEGLKVYDGNTRLTDYSEYVEFIGTKTILLKANINNIEITNPEFVISTNKKTISINDFYAHKKPPKPRPGSQPEPENDTNYIGYFDAAFIVFERSYTKQASSNDGHRAVRFSDYEINILNSSIECNDDYLDLGATSMYIEHSGVYARSIGNVISKTIIKDATIGVEKTYGKVYLDNSSLETYEMEDSSSLYATNMSKIKTTVGGAIRHLILDNSEFEYLYDGGNLAYRPIVIDGRFSIHNSKFTIDFEEYNESNYPKLEFDNGNYEFDDHMSFVDSSGRALYKKTWDDYQQCVEISPDIMDEEYSFNSCGDSWIAATYVYDNEFGESPKTLSIASVVEVRLKVNGTWADGTTDDIVIYKPAFSQISYTDIPVGKMTLDDFENGDWDTKPVNAVLEENKNVVLTLTLSNTKEEVKGVEENPKTGLFNYLLLIIPSAILVFGYKFIGKYKLFKKM